MLKTEILNDGKLIKHFSDSNFMLLQKETGIKYSEAIDVVPCKYTYEETEEEYQEYLEKIESAEEQSTIK